MENTFAVSLKVEIMLILCSSKIFNSSVTQIGEEFGINDMQGAIYTTEVTAIGDNKLSEIPFMYLSLVSIYVEKCVVKA